MTALAELRRQNPGRARKVLHELAGEVEHSNVLEAALAFADLLDGEIDGPRATLARLAQASRSSRFVLLSDAAAAELATDFDDAYKLLEAAAALPPQEEADTELLDRAAKLREEAAAARLSKGRRLADEGDLASGLLEIEAGLEATPDAPELLLALGLLHVKASNYAEGERDLSRAIEAGAVESHEVTQALATADLKIGKLDEAKRRFQDLVAADPGDLESKEGLKLAKAEIRRSKLPARFKDLRHAPSLTRAELAALLYETIPDLKDRPAVARGVVVTDISGSWAKDYILLTVSHDIMDVYEDHTFGADERVSRADLADALARTVKRLETRPGSLAPSEGYPAGEIDDLPRGHGRYDSIVLSLQYGLMELTDHAFRPAQPATGDEAVTAAERLASLVAEGGR